VDTPTGPHRVVQAAVRVVSSPALAVELVLLVMIFLQFFPAVPWLFAVTCFDRDSCSRRRLVLVDFLSHECRVLLRARVTVNF